MIRDELKVGQEYVNLKTNNTYRVLNLTRDSETQEERVVYEESPERFKKDLPWDRPLGLFLEKFRPLDTGCLDCGLSRAACQEKREKYGRCYWGG